MKLIPVRSRTPTEAVLAVLVPAEEAKHGCVIGQMRKATRAKIRERM